MTLHATYYFMSHVVTFSAESLSTVRESMGFPTAPQDPDLSSRLLNRQLKYVVSFFQRGLTKTVLRRLEASMRSTAKDAWGPTFAATLVLCVCIERLQIAADTFVVCEMKKRQEDRVVSGYTRRHSFEACCALDDYLYGRCFKLFHDVYKTYNKGDAGGFNPLRDSDHTKGKLDQATEIMVSSIRKLIRESGKSSSSLLWLLIDRM